MPFRCQDSKIYNFTSYQREDWRKNRRGFKENSKVLRPCQHLCQIYGEKEKGESGKEKGMSRKQKGEKGKA